MKKKVWGFAILLNIGLLILVSVDAYAVEFTMYHIMAIVACINGAFTASLCYGRG